MDSRRALVSLVIRDGVPLSRACAQFGVSRVTGRKWVNRAKEVGIDCIEELSRAPKTIARQTPIDIEQALLAKHAEYSQGPGCAWGARKLCPLLRVQDGIILPVRTAERILKRHGLTRPQAARLPEPQRFEHESPGVLLQMDFKGMPKTTPYSVLSLLDDCSRFCMAFEPVLDKTAACVKASLWEIFGQYGLPEQMLMDNGDCWGTSFGRCPTAFEAWLMLLGIRPTHGRPRHPQTQGKVERFHLTAKDELGRSLHQPNMPQAKQVYRAFVNRYNWVRPHDSLGGQTPSSRFHAFPRTRPEKVPDQYIPEGAIIRNVTNEGRIHFKGQIYRLGKGLAKHQVILIEDELGIRATFAGFPLPYLFELLETPTGFRTI